jgi:hypothetical protein
MTVTTAMTRDEARAMFKGANLDYSALTPGNVQRLRTLINQRMKSSGLIKDSFRCRQRAVAREGYAEIRCKSFYFDSREALTFNPDGFIGFAGWADDNNVQPILAGFAEWVKEVGQ